MPRYIAILFALPLFFAGCEIYDKSKPTEFLKIKEDLFVNNHKVEYFVLSNFPNDSSLLEKIIEEYNQQTSFDTLKKYWFVERKFYRETECLTRNYEEGKPYPKLHWWIALWDKPCEFYYSGDAPGQQLDYHGGGEGFLIATKLSLYSLDSGTCEYTYKLGKGYFGDTDYTHKYLRIKH